MRGQGNKRGEPSIYKEYDDYLLDRGRPAEAISMFQESLRLERSFGLVLHEPHLLSRLFSARFAAGDRDGARATLAELEMFIAKYKHELPIARRVYAETLRAIALGKLGEKSAAKSALELARQLAVDLPPYRCVLLQPDKEAEIVDPVGKIPSVVTTTPAQLQIQPLEVVSTVSPGNDARRRFVATNSGAIGVTSQWIVSGPGVLAGSSNDVHFTAGKPVTSVRLPLIVRSGGEASLRVSISGADAMDFAKISVADAQNPEKIATWEVNWQAEPSSRIVLDASLLESNPFRSISLFHELAVPPGETVGIPLRLRSPVLLRLEYYDPTDQRLLAVDANGNGDFTDSGDYHSGSPTATACAVVPIHDASAQLAVEIRIFSITGEPLAITPTMVLETEIYRNGGWVKEAESILK